MDDRLERAAAGAILGIAAWIAASWTLAITHALTRVNLLIVLALFAIGSIFFVRRFALRVSAWSAVAALLIGGWIVFILWRGSVVPPLSYDAMTYHFPKAALFVQHEGYAHFASPDRRLHAYPANYELLLAGMFLLTGSDRFFDWVGVPFYLLFLLLTAVVVRRWWGAGAHVTASVLAAGSAPLLLLHSGAEKNDLMTGVFCVGALFWSARWCARGGTMAALLAIVCGLLGIGTKMNAAAVALAVAPFGLVTLIRRPPSLRRFAGAVAFAALAFLLLGGWVFVMNAISPVPASNAQTVAGVTTGPYGMWANLWELPIDIVRVSLGLGADRPWPKHDLYYSHFGALFGLSLIALPFCIRRYGAERERTIASLAALIAFVILLPIEQASRALTGSILRYAMFLLPFVLAWTVAPIVRELAARARRYAHVAIALLAVTFAAQALDVAFNDTFAPIEYVRWAAAHRGTREANMVRGRAAFVADRLAGPHDAVAVFGGQDAWIYPAYGERFTRRVVRLPYDATLADVPPDARWLLIDHAPADGALPSGDELRFFDEASRDHRFVLRWRHHARNQAVFERVAQ